MTFKEIRTKKNQYLALGKQSLSEAREYMKANADAWNVDHNNHWLALVRSAEIMLAKAEALAEVLGD